MHFCGGAIHVGDVATRLACFFIVKCWKFFSLRDVRENECSLGVVRERGFVGAKFCKGDKFSQEKTGRYGCLSRMRIQIVAQDYKFLRVAVTI